MGGRNVNIVMITCTSFMTMPGKQDSPVQANRFKFFKSKDQRRKFTKDEIYF